MDTILEMKHIVKTFPGVRAVDDVSISVKKEKYTRCLAKTAPVNPH